MTKRARVTRRRKRLPSRRGTVTTSITLPEELHRRAATAALGRRWVLTELFRQAVAEWLDRHERRKRT